MSASATQRQQQHRRRLLGLEPIFEGGWLHKGARAARWDVEPELAALALFGEVTVDIAHARSAPAEITVRAWALFRDVDIIVAPGTRVELTGGGVSGKVTNHVPEVSADQAKTVVRVEAHTLIGDVTVHPT